VNDWLIVTPSASTPATDTFCGTEERGVRRALSTVAPMAAFTENAMSVRASVSA
jgi:hypothetical protein